MNMLATGNEWIEIELERSRSTLIVGENGAGKSTVLCALSFALFNKPFRKINRGQLVNSITNKGLMVECEFETRSHRYLVRRGAKPNVFEIYRDDVLIEPPADVRDYQEMLERDILRLNHKSFTQVVMLGSANFTPFMKLPAAQRREVIEDLLDIQVFSTMSAFLRERVSLNSEAVRKSEMELREAQARLETSEKHVMAALQDNESVIAQKLETIEQLEASVAEKKSRAYVSQAQVDEVSAKLRELEYLVDERARLTRESGDSIGNIVRLERTSRFLAEHGQCPQCQQKIGESVVAEAEALVRAARAHKTTIDAKFALMEERWLERDECMRARAEAVSVISSMVTQARMNMESAESLRREVTQLRTRSEMVKSADGVLEDLRSRVAALTAERGRLLSEQETYSAATAILKDGGVRAMVVRQYVPVLNGLINKYLAALDFFVDFRVDEQFNEVIKSRFRDEFSYESFSEGEKLRIDLALLFSWRAVARMRSSASVNILVMDEILDGSLDAAGADEFMKVLGALAPDEHVYVISHRGDQLADKFERVLKFTKTRNFSRMEEAA